LKLRHALTTLSALTLVATGVSTVALSEPASAHGAMVYPMTRTYACYLDGLAGGGGDLNPTNPACRDAIAISGKQALWDWFGVLISNAGGRHREIIPDGELCGAGTTKYAGFNQARTDWPTTELQPGARITFRYNAWAPHPGTWYQYITRDGWDPSQPLTWDDLEPVPFDVVTDPPIGSGSSGAEYYWEATLPNKSGRHIIYSIWQRSDSPEAFYNCSDVYFGDLDNEEPGGPTGSPTVTPTDGDGDASCQATVTITNSWPGGYQGTVTVTNTGSAALSPWTVQWVMPSGATVASGWNATVTQSGNTVSATAPSWNQTLAAGASVSIGFTANGSADTPPSSITLNGAACS